MNEKINNLTEEQAKELLKQIIKVADARESISYIAIEDLTDWMINAIK